ncbi:MAG: glutamine-hydrolyzing carbamoyl-phosphate synthase small subunit [Christensenellaceae bacterium]|jgi:carbamoyl-phosphate synthase small subunit|nr:glutamine-hydrolyzing carbamoyl-phosphate synthase small subunit [Christensenellaceae bacterium]
MIEKMLVLENGDVYRGVGFGSSDTRIAELVFNTSMVGYQEILSDPSYCGQIVVMSYPLIGNYGLTDEDYESKNIAIAGFVVREYNDNPSNFRYTQTLGEVMKENKVAGISGLDTRKIVRTIRDSGSMKAMITDADRSIDECRAELKNTTLATNQVSQVTSQKIWYARTRNPIYTIVAVDCGIKLNIVRKFNAHGCNVVIVPYNSAPSVIERFKPDGLFLSNGPGNPEDVPEVVSLVRHFKGKIPIMGICLGHQIIGLAYGAKTYKMLFGHRGANHPVLNLKTDKIEITSQNHSYALDKESLKDTGLKLTHVNVIDGEAEGVEDSKNKVMGIQYHPESAAGPEDSEYLYNIFTDLMDAMGGRKNAETNRY